MANMFKKDISLETAKKAKDRFLKKANGVPASPNPPLLWIRDEEISLTKRMRV